MMPKVHFSSNTLGQYLLIILLIFTFVTYPDSNEATEDPTVWYYNGLPIFFAMFVSLIYFVIILINKSFRVDKVSLWLFFRTFVCLVPLIYMRSYKSFSAHYPVVLLTFCAYSLGRASSWIYERQLGKILIIFALILSYQVIITFQEIPVNYFDLSYKRYMRIPIAASNVIAAYLTPVFFLFIYNYKPKLLIKFLISSLVIIAVILTKSRGGIVVLILTYITYLVFFKYKFKLKYIIAVILFFGVALYYVLEIPEVKILMLGFSADDDKISANSLSSNRLNIYDEEFDRFIEQPIFGNGMVFNQETSKSGAHNLIIELLVQSGLIGAIFYIVPLLLVIKFAIRRFNYPQMRGWTLFLIAMLYHGMIEVNFFNYSTDIIFWSVCGMIMTIKNKRTYHNEIRSVPEAVSYF